MCSLRSSVTLLCMCMLGISSVSSAWAADPYKKPDRSSVSVTGTVASAVSAKGRAGFTLDFGEGMIIVEVDDWDWDDDSAGIFPGERVTVNGRIDKDLYETRSIEARSVYVHDRNTYYYASSADEESGVYSFTPYPIYYPPYPVDGSWISVSGTVKSVDISDQSFEINTGGRELEVETHQLSYNPLDKIGIQKIEVGDRVSVTGRLDTDFFDENDIIASSVVTISEGTKKSS